MSWVGSRWKKLVVGIRIVVIVMLVRIRKMRMYMIVVIGDGMWWCFSYLSIGISVIVMMSVVVSGRKNLVFVFSVNGSVMYSLILVVSVSVVSSWLCCCVICIVFLILMLIGRLNVFSMLLLFVLVFMGF